MVDFMHLLDLLQITLIIDGFDGIIYNGKCTTYLLKTKLDNLVDLKWTMDDLGVPPMTQDL